MAERFERERELKILLENRLQERLAAPKDPGEIAISEQTRAIVRHALERLSPRQQKVIRLHFGFDGESQTLEEIGKKENPPVTRERIRDIKERALKKLRETLGPQRARGNI